MTTGEVSKSMVKWLSLAFALGTPVVVTNRHSLATLVILLIPPHPCWQCKASTKSPKVTHNTSRAVHLSCDTLDQVSQVCLLSAQLEIIHGQGTEGRSRGGCMHCLGFFHQTPRPVWSSDLHRRLRLGDIDLEIVSTSWSVRNTRSRHLHPLPYVPSACLRIVGYSPVTQGCATQCKTSRRAAS